MKKKITKLLIFSLFVLFTSTALAKVEGDAVSLELEFSAPRITPSRTMPGYSHIEMKGTRSLGFIGEPVLPVKGLKVLIPPGKKVKDIELILGEKVSVPLIYPVEPGQKEYPLSQIDKLKITRDEPKAEIYNSTAIYPVKLHKLASIQKKLGYQVAMVSVVPVEYNPQKRELSYYKMIKVLVRFEQDTAAKSLEELKSSPRLRTKPGIKEKDREEINRLIDNKEDLSSYDQAPTTPLSQPTLGPLSLTSQYAYVIITRPDFVSAFEPLKQRRIQKGLTATIVTTDWIYANYSGSRPDGGTDNQTKIRNFIIDAYNNWGTRYVLLAGDADGANLGGESEDPIVPARGLSDSTYPEYRDDNIPADLYYVCLDGTFDNNTNGIYGEITDGVSGAEVDLLAEVCVGRAPVDSVTEANNFVNKTLVYEDSTEAYLNTNYMAGEFLGFGGITEYATAMMDEIRLGTDAHEFTTQGFLSNPERALDALTLYDSDGIRWYPSDLINILNSGVHIINHLGHANVDYVMKLYNPDIDSLTNNKYCIVNTQGCYPAAFDNRETRATNYSASDCIGEHFTTNPAGAVAFIGNSRYGWGRYESTAGSSQYYQRQFWDALFGEGITELGMLNQDSKEDNIPYLDWSMNRWCYFTINLLGDPKLAIHIPPQLAISLYTYALSEYSGNQDGLLNPGERGEVAVTLKTLNQNATNVSVMLVCQDPDVTIEQANASFGNMLKGEFKDNSATPFRFRIAQEATFHRIDFTLVISATGYAKNINFSAGIIDPMIRRITNGAGVQNGPKVSGNYIAWYDFRNSDESYSYYDIYAYDLNTNTEHRVTSDMSSPSAFFISGNNIIWKDSSAYPDCGIFLYDLITNTSRKLVSFYPYSLDVSGNYIVWEDSRWANHEIYLYDITTNTERRITNNAALQGWPKISGNYIIWEDLRNGKKDIYLYDLTTNTERRITTDAARVYTPHISGNYIVWVDARNRHNDIYVYDLSTNTERRITTDTAQVAGIAMISGSYIMWTDYRNNNYDIYVYDLITNAERRITTDAADVYDFPKISGNYIVWEDDRNGNGDIYLYDLSTNTERRLTTDEFHQWFPDVSGENGGHYVVWEDYERQDIFLYILDLTQPTSPIITDSGKFTPNIDQLYASWACSDPESGIAEYQYRITQDSTTGTVIRDWTSTGINNSVTATGLSLIHAKSYYFGVKAKNGEGLWSEVGYSDGIIVDNTPTADSIAPATGKIKPGATVNLTTKCSDLDNWQDIQEVSLSVKDRVNPADFFTVGYDQNTNKLYLRNDTDTGWLGGFAPGAKKTIQNAKVRINCASTTVSGSVNTITIKWNLTLNSTFIGSKDGYLYSKDDHTVGSGWKKLATWTITP